MEIQVKSPTQKSSPITKISFAENNIMLHANQGIWLPYEETELEITLKLGSSASALHSRGASIAYVPFVDYLIFTFHNSKIYAIEHKGELNLLFSLLDEKHPFKKLSFTFQNHTVDLPRQQLAEEIAQQLSDHSKYHLHQPSQSLRSYIMPYPSPAGTMRRELEQDFSLKARLYTRMGLSLIGLFFSTAVLIYLIRNDILDTGILFWCLIGPSSYIPFIISAIIFYKAFKEWYIDRKLTKLRQADELSKQSK